MSMSVGVGVSSQMCFPILVDCLFFNKLGLGSGASM
jgi:hypothetical protein